MLERIYYPMALSSLFVIGLSNNLLPYYSSTIKGAGCQHLSKLWMGPGHSPNWATVCLQNTSLCQSTTQNQRHLITMTNTESTLIHDNLNLTGKPSQWENYMLRSEKKFSNVFIDFSLPSHTFFPHPQVSLIAPYTTRV